LFGLHDGEARRLSVTSKTLPVAPVSIWQNTTEFGHFLTFIKQLKPKRIMEIGSFYGGTLWHWAQLKPEVLVAIDLITDSPEHHDNVLKAREQWDSWMEGIEFHNIIGPSHDDWFVWKEVNDSAPYDFMFIDGDHSYEGVKKDFAAYRPMLSPGGSIAFHDTVRHEPGVIAFANELKELYPWSQFFSPDWGAGILLVFP
jgi:cephalosporin hydroxylase